MSLQIRRVVTGHDANGRAVVKIDEMAKNVISNRPGAASCVIWSTDKFPIDHDGEVVHLKAGDVLVQRGTIHNWINRGTEPCTIAFVLVNSKPVKAGGKTLHAVG